ncbi:AraC family transcriptional regulator [Paenibacillus solisilvae]|uniref:AraC family transcriptional regulator n=1 Tax=Paenibacillus solisilvae TaxID=2486751 RepID=A0ABW0VUR7_9BACL
MPRPKTESVRWIYQSQETTKFSNVPELIMLGHDRFHEASPLYDHRHEQCYEFVVVESGKVTWEVDGSLYATHTGQCFHTRPGEWHRARLNFIEPCSIWWIIVSDPAENPGWLGLHESDRLEFDCLLKQLPRVLQVDIRIREKFASMRAIMTDNVQLASCRLRHHVLDILLQMLDPSSARSLPSDLIEALTRLTAEIEAAPEKRWTNKELADRIGVSESHFYRLFQDMHGQSPANYIDRLRMDHACRLLLQPGSSITAVGMDLGYKTSQHFATVFKKYTGLTPTQWRGFS